MIAGLSWDRPWALWLLGLLPVAWWWLSRSPKPRSLFTGAIELWSQVAPDAAPHHRRNYWPHRWAQLLASLCLLLALAGPRLQNPEEPQSLRVIVDRSPSMYLAHKAGGTRLQVALTRLRNDFRERTLRLVSSSDGAVYEDWPTDWDLPPEPAQPEVVWSTHDRPGTLWLTDKQPSEPALQASWIAAGGQAVGGPVELWRDQVLIWDPAGDPKDPLRQAPAPEQTLSGGLGWPEPLLRIARLWAEERGLRVAPQKPPDPNVQPGLYLHPIKGAGNAQELATNLRHPMGAFVLAGSVVVEAHGRWPNAVQRRWPFQIPRGESAAGANLEGYLFGVSSGELYGSLEAMAPLAEMQVDQTALVVAFSKLLDEARRLPAQVIPRRERVAVEGGTGGKITGPEGSAKRNAYFMSTAGTSPWTPWLAIACVLCLLAGLGAGRIRR